VEVELAAFLLPGKMIAQAKTPAATTMTAMIKAKRRWRVCLCRCR